MAPSDRGAFVALVAVLIGVGVLGSGATVPTLPGESGGGSAPTATLTPAPTPTSDELSVARDLPPGVAPDGEIDEAALAAAHYDALDERSYRVTLTYREFVYGLPRTEGAATGVRRETIRVAGDRYVATVTETGRFHDAPTSLVPADSYANATTVVERTGEGLVVRDRRSSRSILNGQTRLLDYYLSVRSSSVAGTTTVAGDWVSVLSTEGDPWPGVANASGRALVGDDGLVHEIERRYDDPDNPAVSVVVTLRVEAVGTTTVEPPEWYLNATSHDGTTG